MGSKYPCRVATLPNTCNAVNVHAVQGTPSLYNMPGMASSVLSAFHTPGHAVMGAGDLKSLIMHCVLSPAV